MSLQVNEIIKYLNQEVVIIYGNPNGVLVKKIAPPDKAESDTLDWINANRENKQVIAEETQALVIICDSTLVYNEALMKKKKVLIVVHNPRLAIAMVAQKFFLEKIEPGIHPSSIIHPDAEISSFATIGAGCIIGKCQIGANTIIHTNVTIYDNTEIGENCLIHAGTVIGTDGLGCERTKDGTLVKFPHLGGVKIGNDVEIGANCQIAKGSLSNTIIGNGTKINGLSFIAHNCVLGKNVWITGSVMLAGTVKVEDNVTIYSKSIIREQRIIGKGATIGMGSVVTKDIPANEIWIGVPAKRIRK